MSDHIRFNTLPSDHLVAIIDQAESQIKMWRMRQATALGVLALRGELSEYPMYGDEQNG